MAKTALSRSSILMHGTDLQKNFVIEVTKGDYRRSETFTGQQNMKHHRDVRHFTADKSYREKVFSCREGNLFNVYLNTTKY
jgi:hypothetical protein